MLHVSSDSHPAHAYSLLHMSVCECVGVNLCIRRHYACGHQAIVCIESRVRFSRLSLHVSHSFTLSHVKVHITPIVQVLELAAWCVNDGCESTKSFDIVHVRVWYRIAACDRRSIVEQHHVLDGCERPCVTMPAHPPDRAPPTSPVLNDAGVGVTGSPSGVRRAGVARAKNCARRGTAQCTNAGVVCPCPGCGMLFSKKGELTTHLRTHTGE